MGPQPESSSDESSKALLRDRAFWGLTVTQFLGAFNDNVYKQMILLLAIPAVAVGANAGANAGAGVVQISVQGWATAVFSLPFVLFSGYAGYLSDRYPKTPIIITSKVAEILVMALGIAAFLAYGAWGALGTWTVLFLMGTQSAFFGPGKYGVLPELFREKDLATANGIILMTTFLAIIFGTVVAGWIADGLLVPNADGVIHAQPLWKGSFICVGIAVAGTFTSFLIRWSPAAQPSLRLKMEDWWLSSDMRSLLAMDRPLLSALLVSCVFWMVSGIAVPTVNQLGIGQLRVDKSSTSYLVAAIALGIMLGSIGGSMLSSKLQGASQVRIGLWGIVATLVVLGFWGKGGQALLGYWGSFATLTLLGVAAAIYAIPLQVFLQSRPPVELKGRMIATMNQANFVGILMSGPLYQFFESMAGWIQVPISAVFWMMSLLVLPLAVRYRLGR
jgi:acyl-[acyl-carrier-protein]-phospholipid O-acyltransferase/long-chain-fatty-acid--[acyl-carrier-protein] ligase